MPATRYSGPPMTLANMRENGVRSLSVTCELCHHEALMNEALMNVDAFGDAGKPSINWSRTSRKCKPEGRIVRIIPRASVVIARQRS
jgi:hypothetical protein